MSKRKIGCWVGAVMLLVVGMCLVVGMLWIGIIEFKNTPRMVTGFDFGSYVLDGYDYSIQQQKVVDEWGQPQSFYILFYQREDVQGGVETVRYEEWTYPARGKQVIFENGAELRQEEVTKEAAFSTRDSPEQFFAFMNREQIASLTGLEDCFILPVADEVVQDADLYYAGGLTFGLQDGELVYVEAVYYEEE